MIPYDFVITLIVARYHVFSHTKILSTRHIGAYTERLFEATSCDKGIMEDYEEVVGGKKNNMKNILEASAIFKSTIDKILWS